AVVGGPAKALTNGDHEDVEPTFSPDRSKIAYLQRGTRLTSSNGVSNQLWVMNADGTNAHEVAQLAGRSASPSWSWSPDGSHFAYDGNSPNGQAIDLYTIGVDGNGATRLTSNADGALAGYPAWSPDGTHIALTIEDDPHATTPIEIVAT